MRRFLLGLAGGCCVGGDCGRLRQLTIRPDERPAPLREWRPLPRLGGDGGSGGGAGRGDAVYGPKRGARRVPPRRREPVWFGSTCDDQTLVGPRDRCNSRIGAHSRVCVCGRRFGGERRAAGKHHILYNQQLLYCGELGFDPARRMGWITRWIHLPVAARVVAVRPMGNNPRRLGLGLRLPDGRCGVLPARGWDRDKQPGFNSGDEQRGSPGAAPRQRRRAG